MVIRIRSIEERACLKVRFGRRFCAFRHLLGCFRIIERAVVILKELDTHEAFRFSGCRIKVESTVIEVLGRILIQQQVTHVQGGKHHVQGIGNGKVPRLCERCKIDQILIRQSQTTINIFLTRCPDNRHFFV